MSFDFAKIIFRVDLIGHFIEKIGQSTTRETTIDEFE